MRCKDIQENVCLSKHAHFVRKTHNNINFPQLFFKRDKQEFFLFNKDLDGNVLQTLQNKKKNSFTLSPTFWDKVIYIIFSFLLLFV